MATATKKQIAPSVEPATPWLNVDKVTVTKRASEHHCSISATITASAANTPGCRAVIVDGDKAWLEHGRVVDESVKAFIAQRPEHEVLQRLRSQAASLSEQIEALQSSVAEHTAEMDETLCSGNDPMALHGKIQDCQSKIIERQAVYAKVMAELAKQQSPFDALVKQHRFSVSETLAAQSREREKAALRDLERLLPVILIERSIQERALQIFNQTHSDREL